LPTTSGARRRALEKIKQGSVTAIFYEAPHRIRQTIQDIAEILGPGRRIVVARELTKVHEEFLRGTAGQVLEALKYRGEIKGEITLLVGPAVAGEVQLESVSIRDRV